MPEILTSSRGEYEISTNPARLDFEVIHDFIANQSYWGKGVSREAMQRQITYSTFNFGLYYQGRQIGFAQVLTNGATFAYLANVFVLEDYRGHGLSKWLMETIHAHPDLQGIRRWLLATRDAHGLYAQFGWKPLPEPELFMQRYDENWPD